MGAIYQEPPPLLQDLKVTIKDTSLVFPPQDTGRRTMFLSNIDQVLNFDVQTLHFFASHEDFPSHVVAEKLKTSFEKLLLPYDFLAGRLKMNTEAGRFEFDCNGAGAGFVVASSERRLEEVGDLVYPNPAFDQLIVKSLDILEKEDQPLCIIQVTSFKCGGFVMGISTNHATFDGISFKTFLENLAAVLADKPLAVIPCNDRQLLAARSPPHVAFPHPEMLKLNTALGQESNSQVFDLTKEALDFKVFQLTSGDIFNLKEKAKTDAEARVSGFNVVTAHVWRCKALSYDESNNKGQDLERVSTLLYAVNIRARLIPPLPASYAGNAVLTAYASAKCRDLKEGPLSRLVEMVREGAKRMNDEYAKSVIDWGEINKGFPNGEFLVSSWWKLGFDEVEYPWGYPKYSCPLVYHRKDIILLFPDTVDKNGVNVLVALPSKQMNKFQTLFHEFLSA
ncbi:fatty alcohol:caffeoyl-CoA acyltransferase [Ricinus communis]|uniref:Anthranilate N-benzoyltransferase protein, putative n=2 Tax=Ricinus communis TaxID=3988 RepID=B9RM18_RICCO|nr:fatty alcohol:caffeoyl-CoA acyltransferase [Ricinus communis]EEF47341.1 Anthranilate N-benzoyltransferase protein, putative [Ricinus communis]|eukprot:XP_002514787.1 fatty alcohol:caffeoyl-CoA acyltransferase [Ricinus communis]